MIQMAIGMKGGRMKCRLAVIGFMIIAGTVLVAMPSQHIPNVLKFWATEGPREVVMTSDAPLFVDLTLVESAALEGAVCLDGTLPGYHLDRGFGSGSNSWLIHLEGGAWCKDITSCAMRKRTHLGSSLYMERQIVFAGILSNKPVENPDFYKWNRVKVRYCDGASFFGDMKDEIKEYKMYFRGQRIWQAIMRDLIAKGMDKADQGIGNHLPKSCTSQMDPTRCFFPQYLLPHIQTPVFVLNPAYDSWQIQNILAPAVADPRGQWKKCKLNIKYCTPSQLEKLQEYRTQMLNTLQVFNGSRSGGMFINSCFTHCQTEMQMTWFSPHTPRLNNKTIAEAVGDWYFDRKVTKDIDCPYPCDSSCHHLTFKE